MIDRNWRVGRVYGSLGIPGEAILGKQFEDFISYPLEALLCLQHAAEVKYLGGTKSIIAPILYKDDVHEFYLRFQLLDKRHVLVRSKHLSNFDE